MEKYKPPFSITDEIMEYVSDIVEQLGKLSGINELEKMPRLRRVNRIKSIYSSLAIENNSMTITQVADIINGKKVLGPIEEIQEVKNTFEAYKNLKSISAYDIKDLLKTHKTMMEGLIDEVGQFRTTAIGVFDREKVIHIAPPPEKVNFLMKELFQWLRESKTHPLIKSSVFHYEFEFIHPFKDGNGRMGRLWQTAILSEWKPVFNWVPIESIIKEKQESYYLAIRESTGIGSSNPFIMFMLKAIFEALKDLKTDSTNHINNISVRVMQLMKVIEEYPMSANELMKRLGMKSKETFRQNYLIPALEADLIAMTSPDKPKSRNQMYIKK